MTYISDDEIIEAAFRAYRTHKLILINDIYREMGIKLPRHTDDRKPISRNRISAVIRRAGFVKTNGAHYTYEED